VLFFFFFLVFWFFFFFFFFFFSGFYAWTAHKLTNSLIVCTVPSDSPRRSRDLLRKILRSLVDPRLVMNVPVQLHTLNRPSTLFPRGAPTIAGTPGLWAVANPPTRRRIRNSRWHLFDAVVNFSLVSDSSFFPSPSFDAPLFLRPKLFYYSKLSRISFRVTASSFIL